MLILRIKFDNCADPRAALATIRFRESTSGLRLQGDLLLVPAEKDRNFRLGRDLICDVVLYKADDVAGGVDKKHLQIEVTSQVCFVRDLATKNGTTVNGRWLGGPPASRRSLAAHTPSGRQQLRIGDVIGLPGVTLTVVDVPKVGPHRAGSGTGGPVAPGFSASDYSSSGPDSLRLPPMVVFKLGATPGSPPVIEGCKFAATLGGKPVAGMTYLYERTDEKGLRTEKWVVKYFFRPPPSDLASLRQLIARLGHVQNAGLTRPHAFSLAPGSGPTPFGLCFPYLTEANLAGLSGQDLAGIYDVLRGALAALADLHQQGLAHGHICDANLFVGAAGQVVLADCGLNSVRSLLGAELTGPLPSPRNDLVALGELCLALLGESTAAPVATPIRQARDPQPAWPGLPLQDLARRLREEPQITARQALQLLRGVPKPAVNRLVTVQRWGSGQAGP